MKEGDIYMDRKFFRSDMEIRFAGALLGGCLSFLVLAMAIIMLLCVFTLSGCCSLKKSIDTESDSMESAGIKIVETVREVPVKVIVEVPAEKKERLTPDTSSTLSTRFATSTASMVWLGGIPMLRHSLENIPQSIEKSDSVAVKEKVVTKWRDRRIRYRKTVYLEKKPPWWKSGLEAVGAVALIALVIFLIVKSVKNKISKS